MKHILTSILFITTCASAFGADGWTDIFNGKDLAGWVQRGGKGLFTVENGELVGTSVLKTPTSYLCTEKSYGNFILEYDFKVNPKLNSGVQFRSQCLAKKAEIDTGGKTKMMPAGMVFGYQAEIDGEPEKDRWWSAGIYDQSRRGWIYPGNMGGDEAAFTKQGREIFKKDDWNHVRIEALGDSIKTWLNGTPCAELKDSLSLSGFIAMQVHTIGNDKAKEGLQVRWRNVRIQDVTQAAK